MRIQLTVVGIAVASLLAGRAAAKPDYVEPLVSRYSAGAKAIEERSCAACHVSVSDYGFNAYGKLLAQAKIESGERVITTALLMKIEDQDADGDGANNGRELRAGTDPSVAKSVPAPGAGEDTGAPPATTEPKPKPFIPKNAYHPAIVHFPIALFIAGLLLDLIGYRRNNKQLLFAGWINLVFAAITTFGALMSGFVATRMMKIPISGLIQQHMIWAIAGTLIMWVMVSLRIHRHETMSKSLRVAYYLFALAGLLVIAWSGHLGGVFVYGE